MDSLQLSVTNKELRFITNTVKLPRRAASSVGAEPSFSRTDLSGRSRLWAQVSQAVTTSRRYRLRSQLCSVAALFSANHGLTWSGT